VYAAKNNVTSASASIEERTGMKVKAPSVYDSNRERLQFKNARQYSTVNVHGEEIDTPAVNKLTSIRVEKDERGRGKRRFVGERYSQVV
jgi:hypothetical protein